MVSSNAGRGAAGLGADRSPVGRRRDRCARRRAAGVRTDALDELYAEVPAISGILIRIGEGGSIYAEPGWDYYSALAVRSVDAVRTMLTAFTEQAEASGREVIFRTWSVGIGDVGDMHTDADSYRAVLDGLDSGYPEPLRTDAGRFAAFRARWLGNDPASFAATYRMLVDLDLANDLARITSTRRFSVKLDNSTWIFGATEFSRRAERFADAD